MSSASDISLALFEVKTMGVQTITDVPVVEKWLSSPKGEQLFCEQEGLPISVLNYRVSHYNRHKREKGTNQGFVPLQLSGNTTGPTYMELVFPGGVKLKIHQRLSLEELTVILSKC